MEIRVEIKMDDGSTDRTEIIGNLTPETLLNLINKITNLYNSSPTTSQQTAFAAPQVAPNSPTVQPQPIQTTPVNQPTFQTAPINQPTFQTTANNQPAFQTTANNQPTFQTTANNQPTFQTTPVNQPTFQTTPVNQPTFQTTQTTQPKTGGARNFGIAVEEYNQLKNESLTIKERLELFLNFEYKGHWFTSLEVKSDYDRIYGPINLSTVSTYLSRLYREDKLERTGNRNQRKYCIKLSEIPGYPYEAVQFQEIRQK